MGFLPYILLVLLPTIALSMWAAWRVRSTYAKWDKVDSGLNMSPFDFARYLLNREGLQNVQIEPTPGNLTDHYDPRSKTLRVSSAVAGSPRDQWRSGCERFDCDKAEGLGPLPEHDGCERVAEQPVSRRRSDFSQESGDSLAHGRFDDLVVMGDLARSDGFRRDHQRQACATRQLYGRVDAFLRC